MQQSLATDVAIERRQVPRRSTVLRVRCHCTTEQEFVQRYAADICARGMFLRTRQSLPVGARVRFELLLQSGRCALGGVGRVAWIREPDCEQDRAGGGGIAFERLRRGDRAVIERMDVLRGSGPSRFEQPAALHVQPPADADLAKTLFADLAARVDTEPGATAFLSADLSGELGDGGWQLGLRSDNAEHPVADLAEQLEPSSERDAADEADDEAEAAPEPAELAPAPEADVELVAAPPPREPAAGHSTVRPSPLSGSAKRRPAKALRSALAQVAARATSPLAPVNSPSAVYAVSADSVVSLALARSAVNAVRAPQAPVVPAAIAPTAVAREPVAKISVVEPVRPVAPAPLRRRPVAPAPLRRKPVAVSAPAANPAPAVPAAPPTPSLAPVIRVPRRRGSTIALATALTTVILLSAAVAYLSLTDQLPRVLHAIGL